MLFHSAKLTGLACPVCNLVGHVCGDDHVAIPPVDSRIGVVEIMADEKIELKEYEYMVGNIPTTAMLTDKMAKRLNAKPVGQASADDVPSGGNTASQRQAQLGTTEMAQADASGVSGGTDPYRPSGTEVAAEQNSVTSQAKTRAARNKAQ